ncbi:MAG: hypothetical protein KDK97_06180 [Verrucomicrobiales bacterium]|nr:hypothetical protein [Verrucomicrobiales bacterium]MCP5559498.1 hypothetical protein [Verrucomicrobiaceae bacterium]
MMKLLLLLLLATTSLSAAADGLLLDLIVPPGQKDRFQHAEFSCWIADTTRPLKAVIIHQHGCTNAAPDKHPPITEDWHWRALARKHDCALLVPMYHVAGNCDEWNDPDSGSERALMTALADFAERSGRPEMKSVPWVLWGHSGGSSWSAQMIVRHPGRVLAASFRGGCHKQFGDAAFRARFSTVARELPLLFVWGKRETVPTSSHHVSWAPMNTMFQDLRSQGGKVCRVIDPRSEHGCDDSRLMSLSFFDVVLSGDVRPGTFGDIASLEIRSANDDATAKEPGFAWMPNAAFAKLWHEFSEKGSLRPSVGPTKAPELTISVNEKGQKVLSWSLVPEISGGVRALRLYRDGMLWKDLGLKPTDFLATSADSAPASLRSTRLIDDSAEAHTYSMSFLDAAGNESPSGKAASIP